jgi:ABC-type cobalamin transport system ATPase subunit
MLESAFDMVDVKRTAHATRIPPGSEHEVLYEQLATALEEIGQRFWAVRPFEDVVLLDSNPWQIAPSGVDLVPQPGRGVDVGAKAEEHALLARLAEQGLGVIVVSSDLPEVLAISDRVLVIREGRIGGTLSGGEATQELVMHAATG